MEAISIFMLVFFITIEMFICFASQTDVNQTVQTSPTKKEMLLKSQIAKKNIERLIVQRLRLHNHLLLVLMK